MVPPSSDHAVQGEEADKAAHDADAGSLDTGSIDTGLPQEASGTSTVECQLTFGDISFDEFDDAAKEDFRTKLAAERWTVRRAQRLPSLWRVAHFWVLLCQCLWIAFVFSA